MNYHSLRQPVKGATLSNDSDKQADKTDQDQNIEVVFKTSKAVWIWLLVLIAVLGILWYQTKYGALRTPNFFATGDSKSIGAQVWLDDKNSGEMSAFTAKGENEPVGLFSTFLENGQHNLKITKPGCKTINSTIDMKGEFYFTVDVEPDLGRPQQKNRHNDSDDGDEPRPPMPVLHEGGETL
jgi:hypothetical protein